MERDTLNETIRIDLYISTADNVIIYEGKKDKTTIKDVYQLMMYWDGCVFDGITPTEAVLVGSEHVDSVKDILPVINSMQDANGNHYNICLKTWREEGINYPV